MNKYCLTKYGKQYLLDRTLIFSKPILFTNEYSPSYEDIDYSIDELGTDEVDTYEVNLIKLFNKLIFKFELESDDFGVRFKSFLLGFQTELSRDTDNNDFKKLIYIDINNAYAGIDDPNEDDWVKSQRMQFGQLRVGVNTIIIENNFNCRIIPDITLDNNLDLISANEQLKKLYPFYENI